MPQLVLLDLEISSQIKIPFSPVPAYCGIFPTGFQYGGADQIETALSLDELLHIRKDGTYCFRAEGNSMEGLRIFNGDLLVVDKTRKPILGSTCVCWIEHQWVAKKVELVNGKPHLVSAHPRYPPVPIDDEGIRVFGVVTHNIITMEGAK